MKEKLKLKEQIRNKRKIELKEEVELKEELGKALLGQGLKITKLLLENSSEFKT